MGDMGKFTYTERVLALSPVYRTPCRAEAEERDGIGDRACLSLRLWVRVLLSVRGTRREPRL